MVTQQRSFSVRRQMPVLVVPAEPTTHEFLPLSDIDDQQSLRFHIILMMFFRRDPSSSLHAVRDPAHVIREALSKALSMYYPLAGRLRETQGGKLVVESTAKGVLFVEADADVSLEHLGDRIQPPIPCWKEFLHDVEGSSGITNCPLLLFQVTRLSCGGFVLGVRFNHTLCDATGMAQFLTAVSEFARGSRNPTVPPVWRRELMCARNPPRVTCAHREYGPVTSSSISSRDYIQPFEDGAHLVHRSFFFGPIEMAALRKQVSPQDLRSRSTFDILSACIWRCRTAALQIGLEDEVRALLIVNARTTMNPPLPTGYYGNAIAFSPAITTAKELLGNPLGYAVELVGRAKAAVTDEYMRSLTDFMTTNGRPYLGVERTLILSSLSQAGFNRLDFGWGFPVYAGPIGGDARSSFFVPLVNNRGDRGLLVPMCMPAANMDRFAEEIEMMLKPVSPVPINTSSL